MKRKLLLSAVLLAACTPIFGQEVSHKANSTASPAETSSASNPIIQPVLSEEQVLDRKIAAIDAKLAFYANNPEQKKIAEGDGTIASLQKDRSDLIAQKSAATPSVSNQQSASETKATSSGAQHLSAGKKTQPVETVAHLNSVIDAIDSKVAYVKSDQTENQKAIESGWYENMAKQRADLVAKRDHLLKEQTTK